MQPLPSYHINLSSIEAKLFVTKLTEIEENRVIFTTVGNYISKNN